MTAHAHLAALRAELAELEIKVARLANAQVRQRQNAAD